MQVVIRRPKDIGAAIRNRREAIGLEQQELAARAGMSTRQVCRLELHGDDADPKLSTLQAVQTVLGITFVLEPERQGVSKVG